MHRPLNILLIGCSTEDLAPIAELLQTQPGLSLATHLHCQGRPYPLATDLVPDALVLALGADWQDHLPVLVEALPTVRPPFVVVGPESDVNFLRAAMRAGARDAVTAPFDPEEFLSAVARMSEEERLRTGSPTSRIISFINSGGGSGATFLAANVGVALATIQRGRTLVIDMDYQFGSLPTYVDLPATNGLIKALEFADTLDQAALDGYVQPHSSGLQVLAAAMRDIVLPEDVSEDRVKQLLTVLDGAYRYIVVDLPRRIDTATATTLMQSDEVIVVAHQTLSHLHNTKRLMSVLQNQLSIAPDRLRLIVNRYDKKAEVRLEDFTSVLVGVAVETMPSDYRSAVESINLGTPLYQRSPRSALGKALGQLATSIAAGTPHLKAQERSGGLLSWLGRSATH